jgi:hypothetical protein
MKLFVSNVKMNCNILIHSNNFLALICLDKYLRGKTSFLPNFHNKTTSVAEEYHAHLNLITSLKTSTI